MNPLNLKIMRNFVFPLVVAMLLSVASFAQTQIGNDIHGEAADDWSGRSISMPDAHTVAIGAPYNNGNGINAGHVRVYHLIGNIWVQKGADIDGEAAEDFFGIVVSMPDANTLAIGAPYNDGNGINAGHVKVFTWNGTAWVQKGIDIEGEAANDKSGSSVSMPDANTIAIGAPESDGAGSEAGHVRIFTWNSASGTWVQKGADIDGEAAGDQSGHAVSMPDANTVAIGAPYNEDTGVQAGHVRVYYWSGFTWMQKSVDLDGEFAVDHSGRAVSMPDANTLAIGAPYNDGNGTNAGQVRVYEWTGFTWLQKGFDIDGETMSDDAGWSVSMPDASTVAIGAADNNGNGSLSGHVRVYKWDLVTHVWVQKGGDIDGEAAGDLSGWSICMPDTSTIGIGAPLNIDNGVNAGHVRVYDLSGITAVIETKTLPNLQAYPNPNSGQLNIDLGEMMSVEVRVYNSLGQLLKQEQYNNQNLIALDLEGAAGIYFVEIVAADGTSSRLKVTKR